MPNVSNDQQVPGEPRLECFVSMTFDNRFSEWVYRVIEEVALEKGIRARKGASGTALSVNVRNQLRDEIDRSFIVLAEVSGFSWYVAFEVIHALERKLCAVIALKDRPPGPAAPSEARSVFPELLTFEYSLPLVEDYGPTSLRLLVHKILNDALKAAAEWGNGITRHALESAARRVPRDAFDPIVSTAQGPSRLDVEARFQLWIERPRPARRVAIVAPPGFGKTVLLSRFAGWLARKQHEVLGNPATITSSHQLCPVGLFMTADAIPSLFHATDLWPIYQERVRDLQGARERPGYPGLLEPFKRAGMLFLIFDGLDEFSSRRPTDTEELKEGLRAVAEDHGIHVLLSCRKSIWNQRLNQPVGYEVIELLEFSDEDTARLLSGVPVPKTAYIGERRFRSWIRNPMIIRSILDLRASLPDAAFASRSGMHDQWIRYEAKAADRICGLVPGSFLKFYQDAALHLLRSRSYSARLSDLNLAMLLKLDGETLERSRVPIGDILIQSEEKTGGLHVRFFHESVNEALVASRLTQEFRDVVSDRVPEAELQELATARVELDYYQSSFYGFLSELLDKGFEDNLMGWLSRRHPSPANWRIFRNFIEYFGLTFRGGDETRERGAAESLLKVIEDERYDLTVGHEEFDEQVTAVRFNAARALERIHPQAPRPYFDYVSDWGEHDWTAAIDTWRRLMERTRGLPPLPHEERSHAQAAHAGRSPWVMRGHKLNRPIAKRHGGFTFMVGARVDNRLQRDVSARLAQILKRLSHPATPANLPLRINCTWAWVRWYHPEQAQEHGALIERQRILVAELEAKGSARLGDELKVLENLELWVGNAILREFRAEPNP